ncbi:hypothetical protein BDR22DRAFT_42648 [Usnea florida]
MLKSTHKPATRPAHLPLPEGWTQHEAPTGQPYYYNDLTKQSTYTRPSPAFHPGAKDLSQASVGTIDQPQNGYGVNIPFGMDTVPLASGATGIHPYGNMNNYRGRGGIRGGFSYHPRPQPKDRSKSKYDIPGCQPWVLVKTKLGRRFVYNPEKNESFWKIPPDVMKGVTELDNQGRDNSTRQERHETRDIKDDGQVTAEAELGTTASGGSTATLAPGASLPLGQETDRPAFDSDGDEYEEVEVTDDEYDQNPAKRQKTEDEDVQQPLEFNEDDIAFQLAAMGQDYGLDPGEYGDVGGEGLVEGAEGLPLSEDDAKALFRDMLRDHGISPYTTWEKVIEAGYIVEDERYTVLPNMRSRKEVWDEWTRDTIQHLKVQREKEMKTDPKIPYFAFLQKHATPKLYWPEFRRKFKKEPEMQSNKISDKDREKWYREYIGRLKLSEATLKADLVNLLKLTPLSALNKSTTIHTLPTMLLADLRYFSLRSATRDSLIEAYIPTLPPAPTDLEISPQEQEAQRRERKERQRRQEALAERQIRVQEEKRRQNSALRYSKGMLREGEEEVQRAMRVGKEGLLGHMANQE